MDAFIKEHKVILPEQKEGEQNYDYACAANKNFTQYGFILDDNAVKELSGCTVPDILKFYDETMRAIKDFVLSELFEYTEPFYKNFPEEVMKKSEVELYINAVAYYFAEYNFGAGDVIRNAVTDDKKLERLALPHGIKNFDILRSATKEEMAKNFSEKLHGVGTSCYDFNMISSFIKKYPDVITDTLRLDQPFASNENKIKAAYMVYRDYPDVPLNKLLNTTNDILRFYAVLGAVKNTDGLSHDVVFDEHSFRRVPAETKVWDVVTPYANLSFERGTGTSGRTNINFPYKISKKDKRVIRGLLMQSKDLFTGVWEHEDIWQKIFTKYLDIKKEPELLRVRNNLYNKERIDKYGRPYLTANAQINKTIAGYTPYCDVAEYADRFPGLFVQRFNELFHKTIECQTLSENARIRAVKVYADAYARIEVSPAKTLSISNLIKNEGGWEHKIATTKTGKTFVYQNKNRTEDVLQRSEISTKDFDIMLRTLDRGFKESIAKNAKNKKEWGGVYIDPKLANWKIPQRNERSASGGNTMPRGSHIPCNKDKNLIIFGVAWKGEDVDIDLQVSAFDDNFKRQSTVSYYSLRKPWGIHSGDYISAPNGAQELILVDKQKLAEENVKYLQASVMGYSGEFDTADTPVSFVYMERDGAIGGIEFHQSQEDKELREGQKGAVILRGKVIEPSEFQGNIAIGGKARINTPVIYDVEKNRFTWIDESRSLEGIANVENGVAMTAIQAAIERAEQNVTPTIKELVECYALNGEKNEIVDSPLEADTAFVVDESIAFPEHTTVHSVTDIGYFSANLVPLQTGVETSPGFIARQEEMKNKAEEELNEPDAEPDIEDYDEDYEY